MDRDLVTGGTGIVGAHVLLELAMAGRWVRAWARPGSDRGVVERIFRHYRPEEADALLERLDWVEGDLHDVDALAEAMEGVRHVYHAAALVSFAPGDARALWRTNVQGTASVVDAALEAGVQRLCHVSSVAALNTLGEAPWAEGSNAEPPAGGSPYGISKYAAELEVQRGIAEGLDAVLVNPVVVIGPGAPGRSSMKLVERMRRGTRFYPGGTTGVVDARDVASCMLRLTERGATGDRHVLVGANVSYRELFTTLTGAFGLPAPKAQLPRWALEVAWRLEHVRALFGARPLVTRHTVRSALARRAFDARRTTELLGFRFRALDEMAANMAAYLGTAR